MGIAIALTNFQDNNIHNIPTFHWSNAMVHWVREGLMDAFGFHFTSHGLDANSDDDILWHFFISADNTIFSPKECSHLAKIFSGLHISHYDDHLRELKHSFQLATQWDCSLAFQIIQD